MGATDQFRTRFAKAVEHGQRALAMAEIAKFLAAPRPAGPVPKDEIDLLRDAQSLAAEDAGWEEYHHLAMRLREGDDANHALEQIAFEVRLLLGLRQRRRAEQTLEALDPALALAMETPEIGRKILAATPDITADTRALFACALAHLALYGGQTTSARFFCESVVLPPGPSDAIRAQVLLRAEIEILDGAVDAAGQALEGIRNVAADHPAYAAAHLSLEYRFNCMTGRAELGPAHRFAFARPPLDVEALRIIDRIVVHLNTNGHISATALLNVLDRMNDGALSPAIAGQIERLALLVAASRPQGLQEIGGRGKRFLRPRKETFPDSIAIAELPILEALALLAANITKALDDENIAAARTQAKRLRRLLRPVQSRLVQAQGMAAIAPYLLHAGQIELSIRLFSDALKDIPTGAEPDLTIHLEHSLAEVLADRAPAQSYRYALRALRGLNRRPEPNPEMDVKRGLTGVLAYRAALRTFRDTGTASARARGISISKALRHQNIDRIWRRASRTVDREIATLRLMAAGDDAVICLEDGAVIASHSISLSETKLPVLFTNIRNACRQHICVIEGSFPDSEVQKLSHKVLSKIRRASDILKLPELTAGLAPGRPLALIADPLFRTLPFAAFGVDGSDLISRHPFALVQEFSPALDTTPWAPPKIFAFAEAVEKFPTIPCVEAEAKNLETLFTKPRETPNTSPKAAILEALANSKPVHVACHGKFVPEDPLQSGLVLSHDGQSDPLTLHDLLTTKEEFRTPEVTLSVCEGLDAVALRDGRSLSLADVLVERGVGAVCGFQWQTRDAFAQAFFVAYHRERRTAPAPHALRAAILALRAKEALPYIHSPAFMAAPVALLRSVIPT